MTHLSTLRRRHCHSWAFQSVHLYCTSVYVWERRLVFVCLCRLEQLWRRMGFMSQQVTDDQINWSRASVSNWISTWTLQVPHRGATLAEVRLSWWKMPVKHMEIHQLNTDHLYLWHFCSLHDLIKAPLLEMFSRERQIKSSWTTSHLLVCLLCSVKWAFKMCLWWTNLLSTSGPFLVSVRYEFSIDATIMAFAKSKVDPCSALLKCHHADFQKNCGGLY